MSGSNLPATKRKTLADAWSMVQNNVAQKKHKNKFEECDSRKSQAPSSQLQETIESTIKPPRYYNKNSSRHTAFAKN